MSFAEFALMCSWVANATERRTTMAKTKKTMTTNETNEILEALKSFRITKDGPDRPCGGRWVLGTIARHKFEALIFPEHAVYESYELDRSRISKLCIRQIWDRKIVANFDRGWDLRPTTPEAEIILDALIEGLAEVGL